MQHESACDQQQTFKIMITTAATARNIWLIVETIITSQTGIAYHGEHNAHGMPPHYGFRLLIIIEFVCIERYPGCIVLGKISAYGPVAEISASVQNPRFLPS